MSASLQTPGPQAAAMQALTAQGFHVREAWMGDYYDGLHATKRVGPHVIEVYAGNADDGEHTDVHYSPVVYVDDVCIAREVQSVEKAARIAEFRAALFRAALARSSRGCYECAWGKVAGCWRCGSISTGSFS